MAKVSAHIGYTFRVGPLDQNQYGRADLSINEIDTEIPTEPQLEEAMKVADIAWNLIKGKVDSQIEDMLNETE